MHNRKIGVIGLGYVGLPVASSFAQKNEVIGFDISEKRISELREGYDRTGEVSKEVLETSKISFHSNIDSLKDCDFYIVAVPTPIDNGNKPNLRALLSATETVAKVLRKDDIVVYESTVYPGATEEDCLPVLEKSSGLKLGEFYLGYSPERINPGDKEHTFEKIVKVVSGSCSKSLDIIADVYGSVVDAGVYKASSIKVAEAAKVIENTQRDLNIALMNELARVFNVMGIDTNEVIDAASTKWNFLSFRPGLVGGHCIGVDPYYLTYQAEKKGYIPQVILSGRRINNTVGKFIAENTIKEMNKNNVNIGNSKVVILGLSFKENCPDIRNSKVIDIINELKDYGVKPIIHDPIVDKDEVYEEFGISVTPIEEITDADAVILAVAHKEFLELNEDHYSKMISKNAIFIDVKGKADSAVVNKLFSSQWRL